MARTVFRNGTVFDGSGAEPAPADVVVEGGRIIEVGPGLDGDEAVECAGCSLLPGLFDCHVHVTVTRFDLLRLIQRPFSYQFYEAAQHLATMLGLGITSARDAGGADLGVKQALVDGLIPGPRLQVSLVMLSQTGGHGDDWAPCGAVLPVFVEHPGRPSPIVDGPEEMRRKVRELVRDGADVIKVASSGGVLSARTDPRHAHFREDELTALVSEATAAGRFVMAHAQSTEGIKNAVRAGVRSIEHGIWLDDEAIGMMLERGTWLVPTLLAPQGVIDAAESGAAIAASSVEKSRQVIADHRESFRRAVEAGVKVAMGTDCPVAPHGENLRELLLMAEHGAMPATGAWRAATSSAAQLLGVADELGSLEPGKRADVVVLEGSLHELDGLAGRVREVWMDGVRAVARPPAG